jgi:hypothetical protein
MHTGIRVIILASFIASLLFPAPGSAGVIERVVAIVDDDIILLSELQEAMKEPENRGKRDMDVLNEMIDDRLLLREVERFVPVSELVTYSGKDINRIIKKKYIDLRIRPFIHIPIEEIEGYFKTHRESFGGREFYEVRGEIEDLLIKEEIKKRLDEHLRRMREEAYIRIQLFE